LFRYFYIEGYGCPSNTYDLKILEHTVMGLGLRKVENPVNADVIIVNTCAVKKPTEDHIISRLRVLNRLGKPLTISGCLPVVNLKAIEHAAPEYLAVLGPNSLERIGEAIEGFPAACKLNLLSSEPSVKVGFVPPQRGEVIGILPIAEGCLGECSFCCTRFARGRLFSYPVDAIVEAVKKYVEVGAREIWLVAQDTSAYGLDIGSDLPTLLSEVCKIEGDFIVRVGMMSPKGCLPMLNRLIEAFHNPKSSNFFTYPYSPGTMTFSWI
jgi:MiaB/RimO family radical SAM methylthiotransferase